MKEKYMEYLKETLERVVDAKDEEEKDFYRQLAGKLLADMKKLGIEIDL